MTEDDDYMNDYDRPPRARTIEDAMMPDERAQYRNPWHTEPTRWERLKQGAIQLAINVGVIALIALGTRWLLWSLNGQQ